MSKKSRRERVTAVTAVKGKRATFVKHSAMIQRDDNVVEVTMTQEQLAYLYRTGRLPVATKTKQTSVPNLLPCVEVG